MLSELEHIEPIRLSAQSNAQGEITHTLACILPFHVLLVTYGIDGKTQMVEAQKVPTHYRLDVTVPPNAVGRVFMEEGEERIGRIALILVGEELKNEVVQ